MPTEGFCLRLRWCIIGPEQKNDSHVIEMGQSKQETAGHDVARDNVTWPIRIYPRASIEQVSSHFVRVHDHYGLTSCVEVDEITCPGAFRDEPR